LGALSGKVIIRILYMESFSKVMMNTKPYAVRHKISFLKMSYGFTFAVMNLFHQAIQTHSMAFQEANPEL